MKHFLVLALSMVALCGIAMAARGTAIDFGQLPQKAQAFITDNFSKADVASVTQEQDDSDYDVVFTNGVKVEFDRNGEWDSVKGNDISVAFVPKAIQNYLNEKHAGVKVVEIDRDFRDKEIEVKLADGIEIEFDWNGNFKRYDR
ncbi:MAG: PepSY-like domain-containing protein [Thermoguttaceae bacterium]|nr:PepSY-like domain-containing protein [Thermoguttaceae bacterium]